MAQVVLAGRERAEAKADPLPQTAAGRVFAIAPLTRIIADFSREQTLTRISKNHPLGGAAELVMEREARAFVFAGDAHTAHAEEVLRGQPVYKVMPKLENVEAPAKKEEKAPPESRPLDPSSEKDLMEYSQQAYAHINHSIEEELSLRRRVMQVRDGQVPPPNPFYQALRETWKRVGQIPCVLSVPAFAKHGLPEGLEETPAEKEKDRSELLQVCLLFHDLMAALKEKKDPQHLIEMLNRFRTRHNLARRFESIFGNKRNPQEMLGCFQALRNQQRDRTSVVPSLQQKFKDLTLNSSFSFSHAHFMELEEVVIQGEESLLPQLKEVAERIRGSFVWHMPEEIARANFKTIESILRFMDEPNNQAILDQVQELRITDVDLNNPEVLRILCKLRGLQQLYVNASSPLHALTDLPQELATLPLQTLELRGHAFAKIPDVASKIPDLIFFRLLSNSVVIDELPEAFTRHCLSGWVSLVFEPVREIAAFADCVCASIGERAGTENERDYHTAALPSEQFKRIPFHLWFREHFSIPYLPSLAAAVIIAALAGVLSCIDGLCRNFDGDVRECLGVALVGLGIAVATPIALVAVALNLPILACNVIINRVIEPIVSWIRESCCGCDPMVEL